MTSKSPRHIWINAALMYGLLSYFFDQIVCLITWLGECWYYNNNLQNGAIVLTEFNSSEDKRPSIINIHKNKADTMTENDRKSFSGPGSSDY